MTKQDYNSLDEMPADLRAQFATLMGDAEKMSSTLPTASAPRALVAANRAGVGVIAYLPHPR